MFFVVLVILVVGVLFYFIKSPKHEFIETANKWHKKFSVWLSAINAGILSFTSVNPQSMISIWNALPEDLKTVLPQNFIQFISVSLIVLSVISSQVKQPKLTKDTTKTSEG
jgi:amino acid transporter